MRAIIVFFLIMWPAAVMHCREADSTTVMSGIQGADMTLYAIWAKNKDSEKEKAIDCAELFLARIDTSAHNIYLAHMYDYVSQWYEFEKCLFSKAISYREGSLRQYKALDDTHSQAMSESILGRLYFKKGLYHKALEYTDSAMEMFTKDGSQKDIMDCNLMLGAIYKICNDIEKSDRCYQEYARLAEKLNDSLGMAKSINNMAALSFNTGDTARAIRLLLQAIDYSENVADTNELCSIYLNTALIYIHMGLYEKAEACLERARPISEGIYEKGYWYAVYGQLYYSKGEKAKAISYFNKAIEEYDKGEFDRRISQLYEILNYLYQSSGDTINAYSCLQKMYDYWTPESNNGIMLELFRAREEIAMNSKDMLLKKEKDRRKTTIIVSVSCAIILILSIILVMKKKTYEIKNREMAVKSQQRLTEERKMYYLRMDNIINKAIHDLLKICQGIKNGKTREDIMAVCTELSESNNKDNMEDMGNFMYEFDNDFYRNLKKQYPSLTVNESRICVLLNKNLSTKEISEITRQSPESINLARYRLRKKLGLTGKGTTLQDFLSNFN